jgi:hypothetical protein
MASRVGERISRMTDIELYQGITDVTLIERLGAIKMRLIDIEIDDQTIFEATDWTKKIIDLRKAAEKEKKAQIDPLKATIAEIEAPFKRFIAEVEKAEEMFRKKIGAYHAECKRKEAERLEKERQAKLAALEAEREKQIVAANEEATEALDVAVDHVQNQEIKPKSSAVGFTGATSSGRTYWKYEITDANMVPREYCEPAAGKINRAVQSGTREIPGVRIYQEDSVTIR